MIRHYHLCTVGYQNLRHGNISVCDRLDLLHKDGNVQCHTVTDHAGGMIVKYTGRKGVQSKFTIIVHDSMSCICAALKTYDNVLFLCQHICDLSFSFVAPVGSYNCLYHVFLHSLSQFVINLTQLSYSFERTMFLSHYLLVYNTL